jgi:electron transfer flavoprotein alpha subunit
MEQRDILVCSEAPTLLRQLLGEARRQAEAGGGRVVALPLGAAAGEADWGAAGAEVVLTFAAAGETHPYVALTALSAATADGAPRLILLGATKLGMEVAPRLAERLGVGYAPWTVKLTADGATVTAECMLYSGSGLATYVFEPGPVIVTAAINAFAAYSGAPQAGTSQALTVETGPLQVVVRERHPKTVGAARLEEAKTVVDVGQGVKAKEDLALIETMAALLDGQLACSRPVASDRDWFPEWLGLSGKKVAPELCLTVGVSGAIQHIVGIRDAHRIVAVNNDEGAGIFSQADYGIVADLYEFLPALQARLKARGARPAWV